MDKTDIKIVTSIMLEADGGCVTCVLRLLDQLGEQYPSFKEEILEYLKHQEGYPADQVLLNLKKEWS